jgi:hypothetical protein
LLKRNNNGFLKILEEFQAREWGISWKIPGWEQIHEQVSIDLGRIRAGEGEYLGNLRAGRQIHQQIHKILGECRAGVR